MNLLNKYLEKVIYNCNYDITFSGDKQSAINKWAVKAVPYDQASGNSADPALDMEYVSTAGPDHSNLPEHLQEKIWRYYVSSEVNHNIYQDNCPEILFPGEEDKYIYCLSALHCSEEQEAYIYINGETPLKVWINGEIAAATHYLYHIKPYVLSYKLKKGMNTILVEKSILMEYSHIRGQTFVIGINPLNVMLTEHNKRFIDDFMLTSLENSFYVLPDKAFFAKNDEIGITIFERFYTGEQEKRIRLKLINCFDESIFSMEAKTKQRFLLGADEVPEGAFRVEVHDLIGEKRSGLAYIYIGDFKEGCNRLRESVLEGKNYADEIAEALERYAEIPNTVTGCYQLAPEIMNERLYYFLLEKYSEIYAAVNSGKKAENKGIFNVFEKSALLFRKSTIDGGSIGYGIFLPRNYSKNKEYSLVLMGAYGYAASRYPLPVPYLIENEFEDSIILNVVTRGDLEYEYIYELELQKLIKDTVNRYHIKRNNIYMVGVCLGAKGAFSLALKMPDFFAGIAFVFGPTFHLTLNPYLPIYENQVLDEFKTEDLKLFEMNEVYIKNSENLPAYHLSLLDDFAGNAAKDLYVTSHLKNCNDFCFSGFLRDEFDEMFNSQKLVSEIIKNKKEDYPKEINFTSYYRRYNKSYWIQIEDRKDFMDQSFLSARIVSEELIAVKTENVKCFSLLLGTVQMGISHTINIKIDDRDIKVQIGDCAKVIINDIPGSISASVLDLDKDAFEELYFSSGINEENIGLKQVYLDKCVIIKPDYYKEDRRAYLRKMFSQLSNPLLLPIRYYTYDILLENEVDMDDLSSGNFILPADTRTVSPFQQMIFDNTGTDVGTDYLIYKDKAFYGEYFALIKCPNPVNVKYYTLLLLFNSDNMQQMLTKVYTSFQYHPMFENDVIIFNDKQYFCYTE